MRGRISQQGEGSTMGAVIALVIIIAALAVASKVAVH